MAQLTRAQPDTGGLPVVPVENEVVERLVASRMTIAVAESLTAGTVAARLCAVPDTQDLVAGGVVTYPTAAKRRVLGVTANGVVTAEAAMQMATGVRELFGSDIGLALTGVAGPAPQEDRPPGTVFVGWATPSGTGTIELSVAGTPEQIRWEAASGALRCLLAELGQNGAGG
jgi:nicotinamide-nucleotide amidase